VSRSRAGFSHILWLIGGLALSASPGLATMPPLPGNPVPTEVSAAFREGLFAVPERPGGLGVSSVQSAWRIPVIIVSYSDMPLTHSAAAFDSMLFDSTGATATGSVHDYYQWASGGQLNVVGEVVGVVHADSARAYYGFNSWGLSWTSTPRNACGLVREALDSCAAQVNWSDYDLNGDGYVDMLWVVHAGVGGEASADHNDLWSVTSSLTSWSHSTSFVTTDLVPGSTTRYIRINRFTMLPELSPFHAGGISEIGVYCHEFGHALGLPDLYDVRDGGRINIGPGCWSLMGSGGWGGNNHSPEYPSHPGAWVSLYLGWARALVPSEDTPVTLAPIQEGLQVLELSFQGENAPEHYLVEARRREGFDRKLPADGLIVTHVNDDVINSGIAGNRVNSGLTPGLVVVEAHGGHDLTTGINRGDTGDPFPGASGQTFVFDDMTAPNTLSFSGHPMNVGLLDIHGTSDGFGCTAQVRATGWQAARDVTEGSYAPTDALTSAQSTLRTADGTVYTVCSESRSGRLQVVLRTRTGDAWDAGVDVTDSPGNAYEPALGRLGDNDLVLAWTDTRIGSPRVYYRARVRGAWTVKEVLDTGAGEHRSPSIGADSRGIVHVAWIMVGQDVPQVRYLRFPYLSPIGQSCVLSTGATYPSSPSVIVLPGGEAQVTWVDDTSWPSTIRYARCPVDSVPGPPLGFTPYSSFPQTWVSSVVAPNGDLHSVWLESRSAATEVHYQHRLASGGCAQPDTMIESSANTISRARVNLGDDGSLHVVYERTVNGAPQVRYRRRRPTSDWDAFSTDISPAGYAAYQPTALPLSANDVLLVYRALDGSMPRLMERRRVTDHPAAVEMPDAPAAAPTRVALLPNPIRAGQSVEIVWSAAEQPGGRGGADGRVEVFDLAGRHVGGAIAVAQGGILHGRLGADVTRSWHPGVYFVRLPGASSPVQHLVVLR